MKFTGAATVALLIFAIVCAGLLIQAWWIYNTPPSYLSTGKMILVEKKGHS